MSLFVKKSSDIKSSSPVLYQYTVADIVAGECGPIFAAISDGVALRQFRNLMVDKQLVWEDYQLRCIGVFDYGACVFTAHPSGYRVIDARPTISKTEEESV